MLKEGDKICLIDSSINGEIYYAKSDTEVVVLTDDGYKVETTIYNVAPRTSMEDYLRMKMKYKDSRPNGASPQKAKQSAPTLKTLEYDLHAESLAGTLRGFSHDEVLGIQLSEVKSILRRHRADNRTIVLIHGKGDGTLRSAISKLIRDQYKEWSVEDAPFDRYGYQGAVKLRRK